MSLAANEFMHPNNNSQRPEDMLNGDVLRVVRKPINDSNLV